VEERRLTLKVVVRLRVRAPFLDLVEPVEPFRVAERPRAARHPRQQNSPSTSGAVWGSSPVGRSQSVQGGMCVRFRESAGVVRGSVPPNPARRELVADYVRSSRLRLFRVRRAVVTTADSAGSRRSPLERLAQMSSTFTSVIATKISGSVRDKHHRGDEAAENEEYGLLEREFMP